MTGTEFKTAIQEAVTNFSKEPVNTAAVNLFNTLGYNTVRRDPFPEKSFNYFKNTFLEDNTIFNEEKAYAKDWKVVDMLFQLTAEEVSGKSSPLGIKQVNNTKIESYLFFSIELVKAEYSRAQLAQITREINRVFLMPVLIVFKYGQTITLSVINRRLNKKDAQKDVLKKVTVIKDISIITPHRAHIEILYDLSFSELLRVHNFTNFVDLHNAWQKTLDIKILNKRFYRELSQWYFWALQEVHFPTSNRAADKNSLMQEDNKVKEHNAKNLIRLLTRILFVWFVKEKKLIPEELFDKEYIKKNLLNGFEPEEKKGFDSKTNGSKYYRAVLQNLFFATLNQTAGKREFRKEGQQMNVTNLMRYESYFKDTKVFVNLVENIVPFMNGGLFECLDGPAPALNGRKGGNIIIYEDGFSDRKDNDLCVPDYIFFGEGIHADLSEELGDKKQKDVTVNGLINILKSYKFTVTENTPIEEDIALDPELLGKVFENLLASYNPETKTTARKQTGSFYTPREIVNYMVDESLKAYLKQILVNEGGMKPEDAETKLELLIGYNEKGNLFDERQRAVIINAIDNCKILDPACGSGAFPMGVLHKLVHILHKLDPQNRLWKERQIEKAESIDDTKIREKLIEDIETAFESNELDYGRKLYLIENCIYGVDIQPIATQISKLRFFISLIVDQKTDKSKENFGIRPLPNLETKFVAANTLIGIEKPKAQLNMFDNPKVQELEIKLKDIRHRLFSAKTPSTKRKLREEDQRIREEMGKILEDAGWSNGSARQLAAWDPYNQNLSSGWFDPEWMFGIEDGFDVVIGNPPYISIRTKDFEISLKEYFKNSFKLAVGQYDLFTLFIEKSHSLINCKGFLSFIVPKKLLTNENFEEARDFLLKNLPIINYVDAQMPFEAASVEANVIVSARNGTKKVKTHLFDGNSILFKYEVDNSLIDLMPFQIFPFGISPANVKIIDAILKRCKNKLGDFMIIIRGMECGFNHPSITKTKTKYKIIKGEHLSKYSISESDWYVNLRSIDAKVLKSKDIYLEVPKILTKFVSNTLDFSLDTTGYFNTNVVYNIHPKPNNTPLLKYFLALGNSKLINFWFFNTYINDDKIFPHIQKNQLDSIPVMIPKEKMPYEKLVDQILAAKNADANADTSDFERQIDRMVYKLYDLTEEEIAIVEGNANEK